MKTEWVKTKILQENKTEHLIMMLILWNEILKIQAKHKT